jgi:hypothetical protein
MLRVTLTLTSGVQVVYPADEAEAAEHVELVRHAWNDGATVRDLPIVSPDGITDWVRLAHVSAVRVAPAALYEQQEGDDGAAGG